MIAFKNQSKNGPLASADLVFRRGVALFKNQSKIRCGTLATLACEYLTNDYITDAAFDIEDPTPVPAWFYLFHLEKENVCRHHVCCHIVGKYNTLQTYR